MNKIFLNSKEIAQLLSISQDEIKSFKEKYGLPVFQIRQGGKYFGREETIREWAVRFEARFIGPESCQ